MNSTKTKITVINVKPFNQISDDTNDTNGGNQEEEEDMQPIAKKKTPLQIFCERVTIAGLEEAFSPERIKAVQIMFRVALLISVGIINWQSYAIAQRYKEEKNASFGGFVQDRRGPFPNVTVCFAAGLNVEHLVKAAVIPEKAAKLMALHHYTKDHIMTYIRNMLSFNVDPAEMGKQLHIIAVQIFDATIAQLRSPEEVMKIMSPNCEQILTNCNSDGIPFDCCQAAQYMSVGREGCFQISLDRLNQNSDPALNHASEMSLDVQMHDGSLVKDQDATDGFYVFINELPYESGSPIIIPAGAESLITIAEPKFTTASHDCIRSDTLPQLNHFSYYDPNGLNCQFEKMLDEMHSALGCTVPVLDYYPTNDSCSLQMVFLMSLVATDNGVSKLWNDALISQQHSSDFRTMERQYLEKAKAFLYHSDNCRPICSRWTTHVHSVSFNPVMNASYGMHWDDIDSNILRSQIRIIMPKSFDAWIEEEQPVSSNYIILCDIGGMIGVYAGLSMITFVQILVFGGYVLLEYWKEWAARKAELACNSAE